jgi:alcohol-forming fatty acyl-CoA reductase
MAGLGLDLNDRQTLISNISIIFHAAATIKFDESLKLAVDINVHGTKDVIELAKETTNLKVFTVFVPFDCVNSSLVFQSIIHVSTAYSNCHLSSVEEKFYDYPIGYDHLEDVISKLDDNAIEEITPK